MERSCMHSAIRSHSIQLPHTSQRHTHLVPFRHLRTIQPVCTHCNVHIVEDRKESGVVGSYSRIRTARWAAGARRRQSSRGSRLLTQAGKADLTPIDTKEVSRKVLEKEAHKVFDEVVITVRSGDGGNGEIVESGAGKTVRNFKYKPGGNSPKKIFLSASEPADGADGADVVLVCDPDYDNLLHLHQRKMYTAPKGAHGNPAVGSSGPKRNETIRKAKTPPLIIPVPQGTVVRRKSTGQVLGELINPGDQLKVVTGGRGGKGVKAPSRESRLRRRQIEIERAAKAGAEIVEVEDVNWRVDAKGLPGHQLSLQLLLRVVADVGIVGFPNAGKSSLLKRLTRASPEVAAYPFTTLMPNLGVMTAGAGDRQPVLADLPGLIEGAHTGRGLGRMFLRHLRRTRVLLHVVDGAAADPATDYWVVREELRMFNPEYCARPHVVAINKVDLEDAALLQSELVEAIRKAAEDHRQQHRDTIPTPRVPSSIVPVSALSGQGVEQLQAALAAALKGLPFKDVVLEIDSSMTASSTFEQGVSSTLGSTITSPSSTMSHASSTGSGTENSTGSSLSSTVSNGIVAIEVEELYDETEFDEDDFDEADLFDEEDEEVVASTSAVGEGDGDEDEADDKAPEDDEDLWLLNVSEEELLKMEKEYPDT